MVRELTAADGAPSPGRSAWPTRRPPGTTSTRRWTSRSRTPVGRRNHCRHRHRPRSAGRRLGRADDQRAGAAPFRSTPAASSTRWSRSASWSPTRSGRLVFLPADGRGYSPGQAPLTTFSDNDGWADDTCDGPVLATVTIDGRTLVAEPGWVVVDPAQLRTGTRRRAGHRLRLGATRLGHVRRRRRWAPPTSASATTSSRSSGGSSTCSGSTPGSSAPTAGAATPTTSIRRCSIGWPTPSAAGAELRQQTFEPFRNPDYATQQPDAVAADLRRRRGLPGHSRRTSGSP